MVSEPRDIQQDLGAELFDDLDHDVEAEFGWIGSVATCRSSGRDAQCDFLSDITAQPSAHSGSLDLHAPFAAQPRHCLG